jgi:Rrf2 family protein
MLSKQANHALKALLELAGEPERWRSTHELAIAQQLPEPMLEQILLRLRRAGILVARRGRFGGYRLAVSTRDVHLSTVLTSLGELSKIIPPENAPSSAADKVTWTLNKQLETARRRALEDLTIEDLLFDLRSAEAGASEDAGLVLG